MSASENLLPTTELEAVNAIIATIGEAPVQSLEVTGLSDVTLALQCLRDASRQMQKRGWKFNREVCLPVSRDENGHIIVPANALHFDVSRGEYGDGVVRGGKLYDLERHTFVWTRDLKVDVVYFLPFNELPEAARYYSTIRAARVFQRQAQGSGAAEQFTADDEKRAWADLLRDDVRAGDRNVYRSNALAHALNRDSIYVYIPH